jgi:hypothetical protein
VISVCSGCLMCSDPVILGGGMNSRKQTSLVAFDEARKMPESDPPLRPMRLKPLGFIQFSICMGKFQKWREGARNKEQGVSSKERGEWRCAHISAPYSRILVPNEKEPQASRPHQQHWLRGWVRAVRTASTEGKELPMSELVAVSYPDIYRAGEVCAAHRLQQEYLIEMKDAAYVTREQDGEIKLHQTQPVVGFATGIGASRGTIWGALIGLLFKRNVQNVQIALECSVVNLESGVPRVLAAHL